MATQVANQSQHIARRTNQTATPQLAEAPKEASKPQAKPRPVLRTILQKGNPTETTPNQPGQLENQSGSIYAAVAVACGPCPASDLDFTPIAMKTKQRGPRMLKSKWPEGHNPAPPIDPTQ